MNSCTRVIQYVHYLRRRREEKRSSFVCIKQNFIEWYAESYVKWILGFVYFHGEFVFFVTCRWNRRIWFLSRKFDQKLTLLILHECNEILHVPYENGNCAALIKTSNTLIHLWKNLNETSIQLIVNNNIFYRNIFPTGIVFNAKSIVFVCSSKSKVSSLNQWRWPHSDKLY